jgi:hypothetical protein
MRFVRTRVNLCPQIVRQNLSWSNLSPHLQSMHLQLMFRGFSAAAIKMLMKIYVQVIAENSDIYF